MRWNLVLPIAILALSWQPVRALPIEGCTATQHGWQTEFLIGYLDKDNKDFVTTLGASPDRPATLIGTGQSRQNAALFFRDKLPASYPCIQPTGGCLEGPELCREYELAQTSATSTTDIDEILDYMLGRGTSESLRAATRSSVEQMSPEERAEILKGFRRGSNHESQAPTLIPTTPATAVPVAADPNWDQETLRYKLAVEQLGLPADITEDAIEMFFHNDATMRSTLWKNVEKQLGNKN